MRIGLFVTCLTDTLFPDTGKAMVTVLERLGHQVEFPMGQACCGQMHLNSGYRREAAGMVPRFARTFGDYEAIVTPSASCGAMIRDYYPSGTSRRRCRPGRTRGMPRPRSTTVPPRGVAH
jgi:L-lactate dehydrogenase complex protein LldE